ncbi:MAG: DUF4276 family protein [Bryobacteraceae bacterium]
MAFKVYPVASKIGKRGGHIRYQSLRSDLVRWMKQDRNSDARFTTMVDLYRLPTDFPGYDNCRSHHSPNQRAECLEKALYDDLADPRLVPYIQLHEFEALLFADPQQFLVAFPDQQQIITRLEAVCKEFPSPEHIDDETSPAMRISGLLPAYSKPVHGTLIAKKITASAMRRKCAHFDTWLDAAGVAQPIYLTCSSFSTLPSRMWMMRWAFIAMSCSCVTRTIVLPC